MALHRRSDVSGDTSDPALAASLQALQPTDRPATPKPLMVAIPIADRDAVENEHFSFRLPDGTFTAPDRINTYYAQLANDQVLPSWLTFDPASQTFDGTPPQDFTGGLDIRVWAFDDLGSEVYDVFHLEVRASDEAPTAAPIADQTIVEDAKSWTFQVPRDGFADADSTGLVFHANLTGGMPLPSWITFDALTLTFSGKPPKDFFGTIAIELTVDDGARATTVGFTLTVTGTPDPPAVIYPPQDHYAIEDAALAFALPMNTFADPDGDALTYTARLANGHALPSWLHFDPTTLSFSGTPPLNFSGTIDVSVIASDGAHKAVASFEIDVLPVNDPPVLAQALVDQHLRTGAAFSYVVSARSFTDVDSPSLIYSATLADGSALPSWLHFDAAALTFSGTAPAKLNQAITVTVTADDGQATAHDTFVFAGNTPFVEQPLVDQTIGQGAWHYTLPADSFRDFDTPHLLYSATLADGGALPSWVSFDPATLTFSGTPPTDWDGREDFTVTASDGHHAASQEFAVIKNGDFSWNLAGSFWGRSAPTETHYRFDQLYFQSSNDWSTGFSAGFSEGPIYGGVSGSAGFAYSVQAGLLADFTLKPDQFGLQEGINIHEQVSAPATDGSAPWVISTGQMDALTSLTATTPSDAFLLHLFAGVTASASATLGGGIYGGFATPDIDLGPLGSIDIPDITFSAGFNQRIDFPSIPAITIDDGKFNAPDNAGAIDATIKTGDAPVTFNLDEDGIGHISIGPPTGIDLSTYDVSNVGAGGLGTLHIGGTSAQFLSAALDLDALAIHLVPELEPLFHAKVDDDLGGFHVGGTLDSDFALVGGLAFKEDMYFTPMVYCDYTTSLGQTITNVAAGTQVSFATPEGEGVFTVDASYRSEADITTVISLVANIRFDYSLLKSTLFASVGEGPISFTIADINLPAAFAGSQDLAGLTIPIFSNTDHYVLDQIHTDTFTVAYETFRTVGGSGDDFTLTTHQITADGNDDANHLTGNALDNTLAGGGGDDVLEGAAGNDQLIGGDGADTLIGGPGHDEILGDNGDDTIVLGDDGGFADGGDGNDVITGGLGADHIDDSLGVVSITDTGGDNVVYVGDGGGRIELKAGSNLVYAGGGADVVVTGAGADEIHTGDGLNRVNAGDGDNHVYGGSNADRIATGAGNDSVVSFEGNDVVTLGGGDDYAETGDGADRIDGGDGADLILAQAGNDTLTGGLGADELDGGIGSNSFVYHAAAESNGAAFDTIVAFQGQRDHLDFDMAVTGIDKTRAGTLSAATLDQDLAILLSPARLGADHALIVHASAGDLAGYDLLVVDGNNQAGYQAGQDFVMLLASPVSTHIDLATFI